MEFEVPQLNRRSGLWDSYFREPYRHLFRAMLRNLRCHPLKSRSAASIDADNLFFPAVHRHRHTHAARSYVERQTVIRSGCFHRIQNANLRSGEIDFRNLPTKEICTEQTINPTFARTTQLAQVNRHASARQDHIAAPERKIVPPIARKR